MLRMEQTVEMLRMEQTVEMLRPHYGWAWYEWVHTWFTRGLHVVCTWIAWVGCIAGRDSDPKVGARVSG
jgi:hypothetical protein